MGVSDQHQALLLHLAKGPYYPLQRRFLGLSVGLDGCGKYAVSFQ